jgi:hypothetical protein
MSSWKIRIGRRAPRNQPLGVGGKLVGTLFFGFFLGMGLLFVFFIGREALRGLETYSWDERRCEITHSSVAREDGEEPYRAAVAFRTLDGGAALAGDAIQRRATRDDTHSEAAARLAPYPIGATATCYAGPDGGLVLERGPVWMLALVLFPMIFVAIGGIGIFAMWRPAKTDAFGRPAPEVLGKRATRRGGRVAMFVGTGIALLGGVMFWFMGARPLLQMQASQRWDRHTCTVEHSSVVSHQSDDGTTYRVDILYRWDRGRDVERSSRYGFFGGSSSGRTAKAEIVRAHPAGAEVACWVDPARENEAVLERGFTSHAWVMAVPLAFLLAGAGVAVAGRRSLRRRDRLREQVRRGETALFADDPLLEVLPPFDPKPGPVTLRSESSRWGRVIGLTLMALFWNGIVGVFLHEAWQGFAAGQIDWFLTLFLVPFVLAGIGFFAGVAYAILGLRNPRPVLVANTTSPELGGRLELQWRFEGSASRIGHVRVAVKGIERATYQVGTNTRTESQDFFEQVLVDRPAPMGGMMGGMDGSAAFTFPEDSMHSFQSAHNRVIWQIELQGEIPRWPDVKENYPLVVLPAREQRRSGEH